MYPLLRHLMGVWAMAGVGMMATILVAVILHQLGWRYLGSWVFLIACPIIPGVAYFYSFVASRRYRRQVAGTVARR